MKRQIAMIVLAGLTVLSVSSCDGLLKQENVSGATSSLYTTADGLNKGVNAAYTGARHFWGRRNESRMADMGTDIYTTQVQRLIHFDQYSTLLNSEASTIEDMWNNLYEHINAINAVLAAAPEVTNMGSEQKAVRVGELKYMRALYYSLLVRWWGPVPLHLEPTVGANDEESRAPIADVYEAMISDLQEAVEVLPPEQSDWGRATKGAAQHLLALVYLTRGYSEAGQSSDFTNAADLAKAVINSGEYALLDDYAAWYQTDNQVNEEIIWSVQYTPNIRANFPGNWSHLLYLGKYNAKGMQSTTLLGRTWSRFKPTGYFYDLFDIEHDARFHKSYQTVFYANNPDNLPTDASGEPLIAIGDTALWYPHPDVPASKIPENPPYNLRPEYTGTNSSPAWFPSLRKHRDTSRPNARYARGFKDFVVFRLGDTYLIAAEALFNAGNPAEAAQYLNTLRERAAWPGHEAEMRVTPGQVTLDFIVDEWARETAGEYQRWFTLVRTGELVERVRAYNPGEGSENIQPYHTLRPIPQSQIDAVEGEFAQNPGY